MIDRLVLSLESDKGLPVQIGTVYFTARRGALLSSTFRYEPDFVARADSFPVDPHLPLSTGALHTSGLPGVLRDASPDRWGRNLIAKRHMVHARRSGQRAGTLTDVDFFLGVSDVTRQGALRAQTAVDGVFLAPGAEVPTLIELPRLLAASDAVARDDDFSAVKALLDAGTASLGGARPKAAVRDGSRLLIAKFPHPDDQWDVMAWEKAALDLAVAAGIRVPKSSLTVLAGRSTLLVERFDRTALGRIPYISAMTVLEAQDGDSHDYLEIAEALPDISAATTTDLRELWRRAAFSAMINNTDDHLRNHGFLHERGGWRLSPAFDLNPQPDVLLGRQTSVAGATRGEEVINALREVAGDFALTRPAADAVLTEVTDAVKSWRTVASRHGIATRDQEQFAEALSLSDRWTA